MRFDHPAWRTRAIRTSWRVVQSLLRRRFRALQQPVVSVGRGVRMRTDLTTAMGLHLYRYGAEDRDVALCCRVLQPGDTFVDGGANIGLFALPAAARVGPGGRVIAFEPVPATAERLRHNAALNGHHWLEVREEALADAPGARDFMILGGDAAGLSAFAPEPGVPGQARRVPTTTLDAAIGDRPVRLIKLDLEGAEVLALRGGGAVLARQRPDLILEVVPAQLERSGSSSGELLDLLRARGYRLSWIAPDGALRPAGDQPADPSGRANAFASAR